MNRGQQKIKILIVDDEEAIRQAFAHLFKNNHYQVFQAAGGQEALDLIGREKIDICFLDIRMPRVDGLQTLKSIKNFDPHIQVVMMTAYRDTNEALQALHLGAADYIHKPFDEEYVERLIQKYMRRKNDQSFPFEENAEIAMLNEKKIEKKTSGRILVVDDEKDIAEFLKKGLQREGYEVTAVTGGLQAVYEFKKNFYDVILLDLKVAGLDGIAVMKAVKEIRPATEVIIVTGFGSLETAQEALRAGAYDYLLKPLPGMNDIMRIVSRALERQRLLEGNQELIAHLKRKVYELNILYQISHAISYTLDYYQLINILLNSLNRVIDFDVASSFLIEENKYYFSIYLARPLTESLLERVKADIFSEFVHRTAEKPLKTDILFNLTPLYKEDSDKAEVIKQLKTSYSFPLIIEKKPMGIINIASHKQGIFSGRDIGLVNTIIDHICGSVERLRHIVVQEKSTMERMVESMTEGVVMIDQRNEIMVLNPSARRMLNFKAADEMNWRILQDKLKIFNLDRALLECQSTGESVAREIIIPQKHTMILRGEISVVKSPEKEILGTLVILRDITKEKEVDRMKTEFISTVSHELRTPLSITKEGINLVLDRIPGELNEKQEKILATARGNIDRLSRIINNLLDVSKMEAGKLDLKREEVNFIDLIKHVASSFETSFKEKGLELKLKCPSNDIQIYIDADRIIQVLTNLIGNALKFTEEGFVEISILDKDKDIQCEVADTGVGIVKEDIPKLFSKFQQFGRVIGSGEKGTGLGLAISKEIIEMHQGKIWAESEAAQSLENRGGKVTKFIFLLPKYTLETIYREYVHNAMREAIKRNSKMSLIVVSMEELAQLKANFSQEKVSLILRDMETILRNGLRRQGDIAFKDLSEAFVILADCNKENAMRVGVRLEQAVKEYLAGQELMPQVRPRFGYATFPDEAKSDEELIALARRSPQA